jgi:predicted secreted protein
VETLNLSVGDRRTIRLPGRGTAGFAWSVAVDNPQIAGVSSIGTARPEPSSNPASGGFSASRDELFEVTALSPGETAIHFVQSRPWERNKPSLASTDYKIVVRPNS